MLKIVRKKDYEKLINELSNKEEKNAKLENSNREKEKLLTIKIREIKKLEDKVKEKEEQRRVNAGKVGSLTKEVNHLREELDLMSVRLEETKKKLDESMTDKYLVKKLPPAKPTKVRMTTRPQKMKPATRKFMAKEFER